MLEEKLSPKNAISPDSEKKNASNVDSSRTVASACENNDPYTKVANWTVPDVLLWAKTAERFSKEVIKCLLNEEIDGKVLLALCENDIRDMRYRLNYHLSFGDLKKFWLAVHALQERYLSTKTKSNHLNINGNCLINGICPLVCSNSMASTHNVVETTPVHRKANTDAISFNFIHHSDSREHLNNYAQPLNSEYVTSALYGSDSEATTPPISVDGRAINIPPEFFKTFISLGYSFLVTWITSFVMVIVHERVPDMKRYPPLPDIFLDNVPHIPWAFHMCEITGTLLFAIWLCVCIFHKYRMVLLRRFFALAGTVFLLRCVTMLITSLSVPGTHLQCDQSDYAVDDTDLTLTEALELRISRAYTIWSGLGMSIQGVRTCGDYMFSGHTVALTLLNFFITEYTPRNLYFLHTLTWLLNMFGIFFILAAHEHYSIDVFVAFYITSRLFLYYHTLANNQALMSRDSTRTRIWFPMFSYFESSVDGIIPNEFDTIGSLFEILLRWLMDLKDSIMMTAQRLSVDRPQLALATKNLLLISPIPKEQRNASTSTQSITNSGTQLKPPLDDGNANSEMELLSLNGRKNTSLSCIKLSKSLPPNVNNNDISIIAMESSNTTTPIKISKENLQTAETTTTTTTTTETKKLL